MSYYIVNVPLSIFDEFTTVEDALAEIDLYLSQYASELDDFVLIKGEELLMRHGRVELRDE